MIRMIHHFQPVSLFSAFPPLSRATQARPEAAEEGAVARQEETVPGTRTTKSPPSPHPTTPSPLLSTWWSTTPRVTSATRCHTMGSSTRTRTRSCPRSWCPTCWRRTATSSPTRCPRWVDASRYTFLITNCIETEGRRRGNRVFIYCHVSSDAWRKDLWVNPSASYLPWQHASVNLSNLQTRTHADYSLTSKAVKSRCFLFKIQWMRAKG